MEQTYNFDKTFFEFLDDLSNFKRARNEFIKSIVSTEFENCYLEFPVLNKKTSKKNIEYTIIKTTKFPKASWINFAEHLKMGKGLVKSFSNLSGDAMLVVPVPQGNETDNYSSDLMNFLINGDKVQKDNLIKEMAETALDELDNFKNVYISTHGRGIPWLHIRICNNPKYYTHESYLP